MDALRNTIIDLPNGLNQTNIYKLLSLLDKDIIKKYQQKFTVDDEYPAIRDAVDYFYNNPERDVEGNLDEEANQIDKDFLTMMILAQKSTRKFFKILADGFDINNDGELSYDEKLFNIDGDIDDIIKVESENPYDINITLKSIGGETTTEALSLFTNMINHLLYYHNLSIIIENFIQSITLDMEDKTLFNVRNINAIYYEQY